jgi:hypothetical protein
VNETANIIVGATMLIIGFLVIALDAYFAYAVIAFGAFSLIKGLWGKFIR